MIQPITGFSCESLIWSVNSATDCRPEGDADDHQEAGDEKQNSGGTELHVLLEDLTAQKGPLPDGDDEVDQAPDDNDDLTAEPDLLLYGVECLKVAHVQLLLRDVAHLLLLLLRGVGGRHVHQCHVCQAIIQSEPALIDKLLRVLINMNRRERMFVLP